MSDIITTPYYVNLIIADVFLTKFIIAQYFLFVQTFKIEILYTYKVEKRVNESLNFLFFTKKEEI